MTAGNPTRVTAVLLGHHPGAAQPPGVHVRVWRERKTCLARPVVVPRQLIKETGACAVKTLAWPPAGAPSGCYRPPALGGYARVPTGTWALGLGHSAAQLPP